MSANVIILSGYGLNCEEETQYAFEYVGLNAKIVHINDLIETPDILDQYQILTIPGGFSYGDDTGSGNAFAQKMKLALWDKLQTFIARDTLMLGICNGCQILANLGIVPGIDGAYGQRDIAVTYNKSGQYQCRWIDLKANTNAHSPWLNGITDMHIPVAHGEGRFMMNDKTLAYLQKNNQIVLSYTKPDGNPADGAFPYNPNGAVADIAGITDETGKVLALMPHPERGMFTWQRDDFDRLKDQAQRERKELPEAADGLQLFQNAAAYFEIKLQKTA